MANQTSTTGNRNQSLCKLASALIATSDALDKVNRRICFLGEMMGDKEDGITLSGSSFDALQEYLLETAAIAREASYVTMGAYLCAKDIAGQNPAGILSTAGAD